MECLKYACAHGFPGSDPYATALNEVCIPDADERLGVEVALMFHRANGGDISMREFLPVWKEHGELYREAHLRVARELAPTLCITARRAVYALISHRGESALMATPTSTDARMTSPRRSPLTRSSCHSNIAATLSKHPMTYWSMRK